MSQDNAGGWFTRNRETTQIDHAAGPRVPTARTPEPAMAAAGRIAAPAGPATGPLLAAPSTDTISVDRSLFAAERVAAPAISTGDRTPDPSGDSGSVDVSVIRMRTVENHLDEILGNVHQPEPIEIAVLDAQGLLCAELVTSDRSLPAFDQSGLDGYAVRAEDIATATVEHPVVLAVVGDTPAGRGEPTSIGPGLARKVAVGAMLPAGTDVVVPAAWTDQGLASVQVYASLAPGSYVRRTGDDVAPGDIAVQVGTPIGPAQISLLAAVGRQRVAVGPRPRVSVLCAGAELVDAGTVPGPGQVVDINSYALAAAARDAGAEAYRSGILPNEKRRMVELLESQLLRSDVVLIAGTFASGGDDLLQEALAELGDMAFTQVAMHPGPLHAFGRLGPEQVPVICIPGEPVAALVAFEVFVRPVIRMMLGKKQLFRRTVQAVSAQRLLSPLGYRQYLHGQVMRHPDGGYVVEPIGDGDQAMLARMAQANCLIVVDEDVTEVSAGGLVTVMPMLLGG